MKGEVAMPTIFPREEKAEQLFEKILKNPDACERLKETFFDNLPDVDNPEADTRDVTGVTFTRALFQAYENKDLSAFLMAVCGNSMFDLLRNSFLIPIRFNDKGKTNPILLTDETGGLRKDIGIHVPEKTYQKFLKIYKNKEQIPQVEEYLAYGFREAHQYDEAGTAVESVEIGQHLGVLLLYRMPGRDKGASDGRGDLCPCLGCADACSGCSATGVYVLRRNGMWRTKKCCRGTWNLSSDEPLW